MQHGSINCPSHGSAVSCAGDEGADMLTGDCPYGHKVTMSPQSLAGPFDRHWDLHHASDIEVVEPTGEVEAIIDLEQLVADVAENHLMILALAKRITELQEMIVAAQSVATSMSKYENVANADA